MNLGERSLKIDSGQCSFDNLLDIIAESIVEHGFKNRLLNENTARHKNCAVKNKEGICA